VLDRERKADNWWVRSKAYSAMASLPEAGTWLGEGIKDKDPRVASAALEALAKSSGTAVDGVLDAVLRDPGASLELIGTAAEAAQEKKSPRLLDAVRAAYQGELAKRYPELSDDLLQAEADTLKAHPELSGARLAPRGQAALTPSIFIAERLRPATVVLETEKGRIELSLAVVEAPIHAATFLDSVRHGLYDGTVWHRVVTGFVVQGGDPRGSGWGDGGISLRDEINRLPFERGALGMPKAGKDTGGCQLFITSVPTPHLDGRYTVFGKVVSGMDVVDKLEPGDRIRRAYVK
jgi:cyclophilin family peptidyl-prolyl cis-trans isomerase